MRAFADKEAYTAGYLVRPLLGERLGVNSNCFEEQLTGACQVTSQRKEVITTYGNQTICRLTALQHYRR